MKHEAFRQKFGSVLPTDDAVMVLEAVEKWLIERESEQLHKPDVSGRSEQFFKFIDEHYSHSSDNYRNELKNSFAEWCLKNCHNVSQLTEVAACKNF